MLKKALTKSGLRILKAMKKLSIKTKKSVNKKSPKMQKNVSKSYLRSTTVPDHEAISLSWSLASLDTKSIDTYLTMVSESFLENAENSIEDKKCCCCCSSSEYEENQRNENRENEMFV